MIFEHCEAEGTPIGCGVQYKTVDVRMFLATRTLLLIATFVCFLAYPMDAEICLQDFMIDTVMQCKNCTGDLKVVFAPSQPVPYYSSDRIRDINCTVNKPANISIFFEQKLKRYDKKPLELTKDGKVNGITVTKLNGGCTYQIHFDENSKSLCQYGHFTCKATTDTNETDSKTVELYLTDEKRNPPMTFTVEDDALQKSGELILGTYANLSCLYKSQGWLRPFFSQPDIKFFRLDKDGYETEIKDSHEKPPKYENQGKIVKAGGGTIMASGTRKLFLRRIDAGTSATYLCRVQTTTTRGYGCFLEKKLVLRTRPCKTGHYCNQNSSKELPCKEGTYNNINGSFKESNCRICPINSYCPSGSVMPTQCPKEKFSPSRSTKVKLYQGKGKPGDCRSCPVDPCDKEGSKCSFICSGGEYGGEIGQPISIRCLLSNGTLLRNLTWFKDEKKIVNSSSYRIFHEEKAFILMIHKVSLEDNGEYNCSGFDAVMGNPVYSTTNLLVRDPSKSSNILLKLSLSITFAVMFVVAIGYLVQKYLRRSRNRNSVIRGRPNEMVTPIVSETYCRDNRALYGGNPCKYDVFICYSSNDKTWVRGTLLPKLKSFNLQVCIDFEDFSPGRYIIENVAEAIYSSRKTIAVLSPDFLNSDWCHRELMMALTRVNNEHKVIPVMYRECEVPVFLCEVTYLDWCNDDVRQTFWEQLLKTINNGMCLEMNNLAGTINL